MDLTESLLAFADEIGAEGPVCAVGGRTQWEVGGLPTPGTREVRAPAGIVSYQPEEMIVRCGAGTTVAEVDDALAGRGQMTPLDPAHPTQATVGGVLAVGRSGLRRLRWGPVRDLVLEARYVSAEGRLVKAGAPVVKNVTGFDLCRLLVGSLGTLGLIGEVVLRVLPRPATAQWLAGAGDPTAVLASLYRPSSVLWDGHTVWVLLEGHPADVAAQAGVLGARFEPVDHPPVLPTGGRRSLPPGEVTGLAGSPGPWIAEVGVGVVHTAAPSPVPSSSPPGVGHDMDRKVKERFDPTGRLNPGRAWA
ncbi:MAG TPA: FAD-binding protein [Acidimicrobiales bacterium]|nr:FAD-binding protein [Acidimicrobiales bacterium]